MLQYIEKKKVQIETKKITKEDINKIKKLVPVSPRKVDMRRKFVNIKNKATFTSHSSFFDLENLEKQPKKEEQQKKSVSEIYQTPTQKSIIPKIRLKEIQNNDQSTKDRKIKRRYSDPFCNSWNYHVLSDSKSFFTLSKKSSKTDILDRKSPLPFSTNGTTAVMVEVEGRSVLVEVSFSKLIDFCIGDDINGFILFYLFLLFYLF